MLCEDRSMQSAAPRYWRSLRNRQEIISYLDSTSFTAEEIIEFAEKFDPQSFHVGAEARQVLTVRRSLCVGLACRSQGADAAFVDSYVGLARALGSPGIDELPYKPMLAEAIPSMTWSNAQRRCQRPRAARPPGVVRHWTAINRNAASWS